MDDKDVPIPTPKMKKRIVLAGSYVGWWYSFPCEFVCINREMRLEWEGTGREGTDQQLDTLGHYISECVESAVSNGESIMRVRFEGLLVNAGKGDARHGFNVFRLGGGGGRLVEDGAGAD